MKSITYTQKRKPDEFDKEKKPPISFDKEKKPSIVVEKGEHKKSIVPDNYPEVPKLMVFNIQDPSNFLPKGFFIICEGSRRVGKSIFLKWLLYYYRNAFDLALVCSETPHNGFWQPIVSNQYVHNGWDPFLISRLLDDQMREVEKSKKDPNYKPRHVLLILDDIVGDRRHIHEDTVLNKLSVQGRHFNIAICLTTQEPHAIGTALRNNCDMVVIFQQKSQRAKKSVCNDFLNFKLDYEWQARDLLKTYTENHNAIVVKLFVLKNAVNFSYSYVPESLTFDPKTEKVNVPDYQLGCSEQKSLARTKDGSIPLFG